ncbi:hypothetical protein SCOCK_610011 [Actinacidiphila cocklensis]|uniref:Uncharacterized protein n=1 Tax=Actinacidiphila cocklensis TaxID=887465 RepID=A0A9W4DXU0_9ACTN|nr:hypothetical protein SCOCK_610011 [Actinacidiphila cocklensis]
MPARAAPTLLPNPPRLHGSWSSTDLLPARTGFGSRHGSPHDSAQEVDTPWSTAMREPGAGSHGRRSAEC